MAVAFDEMTGVDGTLRPAYRELARWLDEIPPDVLEIRRREAELLFRRIGITFAVYGEAEAQERLIPFDVHAAHPRRRRMGMLRRGLEQRRQAQSTLHLRTSTAGARSCAPASCRKIWCSRIRCSVRR